MGRVKQWQKKASAECQRQAVTRTTGAIINRGYQHWPPLPPLAFLTGFLPYFCLISSAVRARGASTGFDPFCGSRGCGCCARRSQNGASAAGRRAGGATERRGASVRQLHFFLVGKSQGFVSPFATAVTTAEEARTRGENSKAEEMILLDRRQVEVQSSCPLPYYVSLWVEEGARERGTDLRQQHSGCPRRGRRRCRRPRYRRQHQNCY